MIEDLMTLEEAAKKLGVHTETLKRAIREGKLEAYEIGKGYKVTEPALERYVETKKVEVK